MASGRSTAACAATVSCTDRGICPVIRCPKSILNGPCGGSQKGKCEIDRDLDCALAVDL